jgi:hypothetical protein
MLEFWSARNRSITVGAAENPCRVESEPALPRLWRERHQNPDPAHALALPRAASGHAAAPTPRSVMNSRRLMSDMGLPPSGADTGHDTSKRPPRPRPAARPLVR